MNSQILTLATDTLIADPNQPRRIFSEAALLELAESIKGTGLLQPIVARWKEVDGSKKTMIVFGERRFRAAKLAGLATVPVIIRDMTDEEALQQQIVENLQRQDVHPLEEAVAFRSLQERGLSTTQIGERVGKGDRFVRQRIFITRLSDNWQQVYINNHIGFKEAVRVAQLDDQGQAALYDECVRESEVGREDYRVNLNQWAFNQVRADLLTASFDITDKSLNPAMGACTGCRFNSAVASLFPGDEAAATCSNVGCFRTKTAASVEGMISEAKSKGLPVVKGWGVSDKEAAPFKAAGLPLLERGDVDELDEPDAPESLEKWLEDYEEEDYAEAKADHADMVRDYEQELAEYEQKKASGKYTEALMVTSDRKSPVRRILVRVTKPQKAVAVAKAAEAAAEGTADTAALINALNEEYIGIQNREKRAQELDREKVYPRVMDAYGTFLKAAPVPFTDTDVLMLRWYVLHKISWYKVSEQAAAAMGATKTGGYGINEDELQLAERMTDEQFAHAVRVLMLQEFGSALFGYTGTRQALQMAEAVIPETVSDIKAEQQAIAEKRGARVAERLAELDQKIAKAEEERQREKNEAAARKAQDAAQSKSAGKNASRKRTPLNEPVIDLEAKAAEVEPLDQAALFVEDGVAGPALEQAEQLVDLSNPWMEDMVRAAAAAGGEKLEGNPAELDALIDGQRVEIIGDAAVLGEEVMSDAEVLAEVMSEEAPAEQKPKRKGGWPKGKPRKPKAE